jgi:hypothetical protein
VNRVDNIGMADNSYLNRNLPNPFYGIIPRTISGSTETISVQNFLTDRLLPQFEVVLTIFSLSGSIQEEFTAITNSLHLAYHLH